MFKIYVNWERPIPLFDLVSLAYCCYFLFWEERDIKFKQNTYLSLILIEVGYEK